VRVALAITARIRRDVLGVTAPMKLHGHGRPDIMDSSSYQ
jgi:hypothetical protein